jgi:crotonobetaine/carnitine-CoA ligase
MRQAGDRAATASELDSRMSPAGGPDGPGARGAGAPAQRPDAGEERRVVRQLVAQQVAERGDRVFLRVRDRAFTFREIDAAANRVANALGGLGVATGDRVGVMLPNCAAFVHAFFGMTTAGIVEVPINTGLRGPGLAHVINHSGMGVIIVAREHLGQLADVAGELRARPRLIVYGAGDGAAKETGLETIPHDVLESGPDTPPAAEVSYADPLAIFYTSGTTGPAKGVVLPQNYAWWHARQRIRLLALSAADRWYTCLPLFHVNAHFITLVSSWVAGAEVVLGERFSARGFWDDIRRSAATGFNLIGSMPTMLLNQPAHPRDGEHGVRLALAAPPPERFEEFERRFRVRCVQSFGMTEASPILMEPLDAGTRPSIGRAIAGHEVRVVDDHDAEVPPGVVGELVFRPRAPFSMMLEYYRQPEATLQAMRNFWFHTGDLVYRDADGYFFYIDRKKDSIRRRGENVSSFEVESVIDAHPAVAESAAIAVPSELGEDEVKIVVVLKAGHRLTPEALIAECGPRLATFAVPRYVEFVERLPKTATHRVEKYQLRQEWRTPGTWDRLASGARQRTPPARAAAPGDVPGPA